MSKVQPVLMNELTYVNEVGFSFGFYFIDIKYQFTQSDIMAIYNPSK